MVSVPQESAKREIHDDLMYLAGKLPHRSAQTVNERRAAEYIRNRLRSYTEHAELQEFHAIENYRVLFASYYFEFVIAGFLALWWPLAGAAYGAYAFVCYLAEFMGFRVWSRMLPEYETQNVVARFLGTAPRISLVVTAHYDSGSTSPLTEPHILPKLRPMHHLVLLAMVLVIATSLGEGLSGPEAYVAVHGPWIRWTALAFLIGAGSMLFLSASQGEDIRGANNNASGVSALLQVGAALAREPLPHADVILVATGSHEAWMSGIRHFLQTHKLNRATTCFVNLESVGAGKLHFIDKEGMLHRNRLRPPLREAVAAVASASGTPCATLDGIPTASHILHARGYHAVTLMGLSVEGTPAPWNSVEDRFTVVDEESIAEAAQLCSDLLHHLAEEAATRPADRSIFSG